MNTCAFTKPDTAKAILRVLTLLLCFSMGSISLAQEKEPEDSKSKFLDDALAALEKAKRRRLLEDSTQKVEERDRILKSVREKAEQAARERPGLSDLDLESVKSKANADALIKRASPEARRLIGSARSLIERDRGKKNGDRTNAATATPVTTAKVESGNNAASARSGGGVKNSAIPVAESVAAPAAQLIGGVPVPAADTDADVPLIRNREAKSEKMRVVCQGTSFYDKSGNVVLFDEQVVARHPTFQIECEEMEIFLEAGAITPVPTEAKTKSKPAAGRDSSGIRRAIAKGKGKQVALVRYTPKGELTGKCGLAIYDGRTGDIELRDWPTVSNKKFVRRAATKDAVIIIRQNGDHETNGKFLDEAAIPSN